MNNDTTSHDTSSYFSGMVIDFEKETNSELLETNELELPTSGDSARARCLETAYVGDDTNETMGLRWMPGLLIHTAMVCDHPKILICNRAAQGWYHSSFTPIEQHSSSSQCVIQDL